MIVFRIEHKVTGEGPLNTTDFSSEIKKIRSIFKNHNAPFQMNCEHLIEEYHYFGWSNIHLFRGFINMDKKKNAHSCKNWVVSVYETNDDRDIILPDGQVAFVKEKATKIDEIKLRNINMVKKYDRGN